ncbi:hypothetical protein L1987_74787 [Smallanthus sonchifolius]|uniref:Uncharacterized protein n=1 Tax=Smallanthus sonchifolius TaxID=185202 RepID=A0ACB9A3W7_9ASTR|nr:hypothetical protein L1987_74787 [Smallanthus sonchifolius]
MNSIFICLYYFDYFTFSHIPCQRLTPFLCCVLLTGLLNSELLLCYWYSKLYYRLFLCRKNDNNGAITR